MIILKKLKTTSPLQSTLTKGKDMLEEIEKRQILGMLTYTGEDAFHTNESNENWANQEDIEQSLFMQCRYNGHLREHYSVLQHVTLAAEFYDVFLKEDIEAVYGELVSIATHLAILHHDDAEAYVGDMPLPFKRMCPAFKELELVIESNYIWPYHEEVYGINIRSHALWDLVKQVDIFMLYLEREHIIRRAENAKDGLWGDWIENHPFVGLDCQGLESLCRGPDWDRVNYGVMRNRLGARAKILKHRMNHLENFIKGK